ncbi:MAG: RsmG family class I SAM-dependent methyltransferase [Rhodothermales bacterium]
MRALTADQEAQLTDFAQHLHRFNATHNLVARPASVEQLERHIRHCLYLTHRAFPDGATVVDWGTGGGLPAIPLAIAFPNTRFVAVDAVDKKIMAARAMARRLGLANLEAWHGRAEAWPGVTHYSVSRATAPLATLWAWHVRVAETFAPAPEAACWPPGLIGLKGGDLAGEIEDLVLRFPDARCAVAPLEDLGAPSYYEEKVIVQVTRAPEA